MLNEKKLTAAELASRENIIMGMKKTSLNLLRNLVKMQKKLCMVEQQI
mgnify:CR=1 FL=1